MNSEILRKYSEWFGLGASLASLLILAFVKYTFVFGSGNTAGRWITATILLVVFAVIFGFVSLGSWHGRVALLIASLVTYVLLFTPLYAVS